MSSNIRFLTPIEAVQEYMSSSYIKYMTPHEKHQRGNNIKMFYFTNIKTFTENEKRTLVKCIKKLQQKIDNTILNVSDWSLIKLGENVDYNFPYTINRCIVLPEQWLKIRETALTKLLLHELVHILQRYNLNNANGVFEQKYKDWGWHRINSFKNCHVENDSNCNVFKTMFLNNEFEGFPIITNPDTAGEYFVWTVDDNDGVSGHLYYPVLYLENGKHSFTLIDLQRGKRAEKNIITKYKKKFNWTHQIYHPYELIARLIEFGGVMSS